MSSHIVWIIGFLIIGIYPGIAVGQPAPASQDAYMREVHTPRGVDEKTWEKATKRLHFELPEEQKQSGDSRDGAKKPSTNSRPLGLSGTWIQVLWVVFFAIGMVFILRALRKISKRRVKEQEIEIAFEKLDILTPVQEVEQLLRDAIARRDYPSAVRLYFLYTLQQLQGRNLIRWKKDKTNYDYLLDMRGTAFVSDFQVLVQWYDRVHYGAFRPEEQEFTQMKQRFDAFLNVLQRTTPEQKMTTHG